MKKSIWLALSVVLMLSFTLATTLTAAASGMPSPVAQNATPLPEGTVVARFYYNDPAEISLLSRYDVFEYNNTKEKYVLVALDIADYKYLRDQGYHLVVDEMETAKVNQPLVRLPGQTNGIPGYPCYRTIPETYATGQSIAAAHPTLAQWIDVGDSWDKLTPGGAAGYDMQVLVLTNTAIPGPKPKLFITASIHAREYTPAELTTRFAEYLINNYGIDADATWLLDYHEIHLMFLANPDGRAYAEQGQYWRKNTNQNYCGATSSSRGADLNRNFAFQWGCCGGSSSNPCDETYRGPSAASEPETQVIENYMLSIFPDQRPDPLPSPAPADATGVYLDLHSYSELVLWPWGFTSTPTGNATAFTTLGRKYAYFNSYLPEQSIGLYPTDGTTDDYAYGVLGVSAMTFELGTDFFQDCSTFENTILPTNMPALLYAAKVSRTPYMTPAGPDALSVTVSPGTVTAGDPATLTASTNDTRYNNTNGAEPTQNIAAAEYYVDTPPWVTGAIAHPMAASDGNFNSPIEGVTATIDTNGLNGGRHIIFVRGKDALNNWGAVSAVFLNVSAFSVSPASQAVCAPSDATYNINVGYAGSVTFSLTGNPAGTTTNFSVNPVAGPGSTVLTVGNTGAAAPGSYTMNLTGAYAGGSQTSPLQLTVSNATPGVVTLISPANNATNVPTTPTFTWNAVAQAAGYSIQVATDAGFTNVVASASGLTSPTWTSNVTLSASTRYYWRVWASNACGAGSYSAVWSFTTAAIVCNTSAITIPASGVATPYPSAIAISGQGTVLTDVNMYLQGLSHTYPDDIDMLLVGPQGQNLIIMSDAGGSTDVVNADVTFDDAAASQIPDSGPLVSGTYKPTNIGSGDTFPAPAPAPSAASTLATFNTTNPNGTWSLYVYDDASGDAGSIAEGWCLELATEQPPTAVTLSSVAAGQTPAPVPMGVPVAALPAAAAAAMAMAVAAVRRRH